MAYTQTSGRQAEDLAQNYLLDQGLQLLERNYNTRYGEIDLIMQERDTTVFVEVRFRQQRGIVDPLASIDWRKQAKLARTASHYLQQKHHHAYAPARFDVIAVTRQDSQVKIEWIKNAFEVQGN